MKLKLFNYLFLLVLDDIISSVSSLLVYTSCIKLLSIPQVYFSYTQCSTHLQSYTQLLIHSLIIHSITYTHSCIQWLMHALNNTRKPLMRSLKNALKSLMCSLSYTLKSLMHSLSSTLKSLMRSLKNALKSHMYSLSSTLKSHAFPHSLCYSSTYFSIIQASMFPCFMHLLLWFTMVLYFLI